MCTFLVVGDATVDQMYFVPALPDAGGERTATRAVMQPGGAGGTIATVLARLGDDVRIATRVGNGPFAELALRNLREAGVSTDLLQIDDERQTSSVTILITPDTQRTMISALGASRYLDASALETTDVTSVDAVVMSAYSLVGGKQREYAIDVLDTARANGIPIFIDMGSGAVQALGHRLIDLIHDVDYVLMNEKELFALTDESNISDAVTDLARHGLDRLIVKVGEMGSIVVTPETTELVEAMDIDDVVDSTGAGDYYTAAFAHAIMAGSEPLEAARLANVAGGLNTRAIGAQSAAVDVDTLRELAAELEAGADAPAAVGG